MANKLIIVESPSKAKTISSYLGNDYQVLSSVGHIRDLATKGVGNLGLDVDNNFKPTYDIIKGKNKVVNELKKAAKDKQVLLATDADREGEAIAWHIADELGLNLEDINRIVFTEITKPAIIESLDSPRKIDINLVNSQEVRRAIDRIIGFKLSGLLKRKIKAKSAGRVQSVALKLIVDLEKEIKAFIPEDYYEIEAKFKGFKADYIIKGNKRLTEAEAKLIVSESTNPFKVESIDVKENKRNAPRPFITSTLQQDANIYLNMSSSKTMMIAQQLYEGIEINGSLSGLITYMRTDSNRLSPLYISQAYKYIEDTYGIDYKGKYYTTNKSGSQDAHEAIRPTSISNTPEKVKPFLTNDQYKLYERIYNRTLASLMTPAIFENTKVTLNANNHLYSTTGTRNLFLGFLKVYEEDKSKDTLLPELSVGEQLNATKVEMIKKTTKPKARYNEASLIKEMESLGIGRPSTYAATINTIKAKDRNYVQVIKKRFHATDHGILTSDRLDDYFSQVINVDYTKNMEEQLDLIASGKEHDVDLLKNFYYKFIDLLDIADEKMPKVEPVKTDKICPKCGSPLVIRTSSYGKFYGCSNFPKCKFTENITE